MRYHYEKPAIYLSMYGEAYICEHPVYDRCTLYLMDGRGLAVIQQRFDAKSKSTYWDVLDEWLTDCLYLHSGFKGFFCERAGRCDGGLYPTVTARQIMWALGMKPLVKERWETVFDRREV